MSRLHGKNEQSSESEEETSTRHDRFKSERFQDSSLAKSTFTRREENSSSRSRNDDQYRNRSHRDRSPLRTHRYKETSSSSFRDRTESKPRHNDNRKEKRHHHKSSKHEKTYIESEKNIIEPQTTGKVSKTNLSSLLKDFDRKVESKRSDTDSKAVIGPVLPPSLMEKLESKGSDDNFVGEDSPTGFPNLRQDPENSSNSDNSSVNEPTRKSSGKNVVKVPQNGNTTGITVDEQELEGPALPPSLCNNGGIKDITICSSEIPNVSFNESSSQKLKQSDSEERDSPQLEPESFGPALPPKVEANTYGPALPPKLESDSYGPALPPRLNKSTVCGPALPKEGIPEKTVQESDEDEEIVGPLPEGKMTLTQYQLNLRAMDIKRKIEEEKSGASNVEEKREEWMLELPPEKAANLGLGPRSFRMREAPDMSNRSSWTDTPADKLRKEQQAQEGEPQPVSSEEMMKAAFIQERNEAMEKISKHSKEHDRPKSLLEMHQKKLKKKKKKQDKEEKGGKKKERRPFDRNIDLQVNRFDDAQKKAIFKKARLLDTRFSTGESKFL